MQVAPLPSGFTLDDQPPPKRKASTLPPPPDGFRLDADNADQVEATDGDTLRLPEGGRVRVWGVDAPETGQPGFPRTGRPVDLGEAARAFAATAVRSGTPSLGDIQGYSYNRAVAPVSVDRLLGSTDLGESLIRSGSALAAPSYLADDPKRRADYMEAERLARLNKLGQHDFLTVDPAKFRKEPDWKPQTETVAQFFDTPTPWAGLRPEAETRLFAMFNDRSISPADVVAFARENGGVINPADVTKARAAADKTGQKIGVAYAKPPQILTDGGGGAVGTAARQFSSGILSGGLDEAGAVIDMFGLTDGRENVFNSDHRLADIWFNNQQQNSSILGYDEYARPNLSAGAELTGAFVQPFPGGKFNSFRKLAGWGGAYAASEGFLGTEGGLAERSIAGLKQAPIGVAAGGLGGKALEAMLPYAQKLGAAARERLRPAPRMDDIADGLENAAPPPFGFKVDDTVPQAPLFAQAGDDFGDAPLPPQGFTIDRTPSAMAMDAGPMPSHTGDIRQRDYIDLTSPTRPQPMGQPLSEAQRQAIGANINPRDVLPMPSNQVEDMAEAAAIEKGRITPARPVDERTELGRQLITNWQGRPVPKVGPVDMVGYLRTQGGLVDQGGELSAMGLRGNLARRGMDHVGQEQQFGPMVNNETGLTLDEAADRAWREGYFPDHPTRPTTGEFLDALRDTYEGTNRRFLPDDMPQLERYDAARTDRLDLEQRIAEDGPVYQDRSQPVDEPAPLPPVEAYEEWGGKAPDFAGNINLSKLDTPQDITRALTQTEQRVGFDAATRGRVAQAETERLAAELNMTPEQLLSRHRGQSFNAEEALAARQLLAKSGNELVNAARAVQRFENPGDDRLADFRQKWIRHVAIQEQVVGMTAEAGRTLAQFRMLADSNAVKGNVLSAIVKGGGGLDNLKNAADTLLEAVETSPGKFNTVTKQALKSKWANRAKELYVNMLLSGPQTHIVNAVSNTLTQLGQLPEHAVAGVIGGARQALPKANPERVTATEVGRRAFAMIQGTKDGARLFSRALGVVPATKDAVSAYSGANGVWSGVKGSARAFGKTFSEAGPSDMVTKVEGDEFKAIPGALGEIVRMPSRLLNSSDELFKGVARAMEINGLAARMAHSEGLKGQALSNRIAELIANPTDDMIERSLDYGRYLTFQRPLGTFASKLAGMANDDSLPGVALKAHLPFIRTPTNLLKFSLERSPAAPLLKEWRADFKAGGARRDLAVAKAVVGTGFGLTMYEMAKQGLITGSAPTDPAKARLMYADGWQPYSVKIGDQWYSYKRLDPFSTTVGVAADMALLPQGMSERQQEEKATLLVASIMGNLASKTWLSGMADLVGAIEDPQRNADNMIQRLVGAMLVPTGVAQMARYTDPTLREVETVGDAVRNRIPGLSDNLLPRRDVWGRPIVSEGGFGPDFLSPAWVKTQLNDSVNSELLKLGYAPGEPGRKIGGRELSAPEYDRYHELAGGLSHDRLAAIVTTPQWRGLDPEQREKLAKKVVDKARDDAKAQLFGGPPTGGGSSPPAPLPPPPGFTVEGESGGVNVYRDLQEAIPGIRFTSGYRDQAYQDDMRRRGYNPAWNSDHLSGKALDMLPPEGKSLAWLREKVAREKPGTPLLIHDGHLHGSFPGYYGAPPLEGAKAAGLRNPNAGMPPPPPGFKLDAR